MGSKKKVAVLIKTCQGRPSLLWTLESIEYALKKEEYRIYISDEKPLDEWKKGVYDRLNNEGHHIELHESGISCGVARNKLIDQLQDEELVLRLDDDFELGGEFDYAALKTILEMSSDIGFCSDFERQLGHGKGVRSGSIRPAGGDFKIKAPKLIKYFHGPIKRRKKESGIRYSIAEHTRNLLLIKREVFDSVRWSEKLMFQGEHEEFMLSMRDAGYKGAYTPDSIHYHRDDLANFRTLNNTNTTTSGNSQSEEELLKEVFMEQWGCNDIVLKYPYLWYVVEAGRRLVAKSIS